jgi:hypothetical protein
MSNRKLNRENVRIGENLRQAILRARARYPSLTNKYIATTVGIHPVHLSRIINGYGASMATIEAIAGVIGVDANKIVTKGLRKPLYAVRTIEEVINDEAVLNQFVGGADPIALDWARERLRNIFEQCRKRRGALA